MGGDDDIRARECDKCRVAHAAARIDFDSGGRIYLCHHHLHESFPEDGTYPGVAFTYAPLEG